MVYYCIYVSFCHTHDYGIYKQINIKQKSHMHCNLPATINHRQVGDWWMSVRQHIQNMPSHGQHFNFNFTQHICFQWCNLRSLFACGRSHVTIICMWWSRGFVAHGRHVIAEGYEFLRGLVCFCLMHRFISQCLKTRANVWPDSPNVCSIRQESEGVLETLWVETYSVSKTSTLSQEHLFVGWKGTVYISNVNCTNKNIETYIISLGTIEAFWSLNL